MTNPNEETLEWRININSIYKNLNNIFGYVNFGKYYGPILALNGEKSFPFTLEDYKGSFPLMEQKDIKIITNAGNIFLKLGHWVYADNPNQCINELNNFIDNYRI